MNNKKEAHWDKNNDGYVDAKEAKMRNKHGKFKKKDVNGDGVVNWQDKRIIQSKNKKNHHGQPHNKPKIKDMNGDGVTDWKDRKIMISKGKKPHHGHKHNTMKADQNHDGHVDKFERNKAKSKVNTPSEAHKDTDNSGWVEKDER